MLRSVNGHGGTRRTVTTTKSMTMGRPTTGPTRRIHRESYSACWRPAGPSMLRQSFGNYTYAAAQLGSGRILRRAALRLRLW